MTTAIGVIILCCQWNMYAQSDFVITGGDATGSNGSVAYTVGETFYTNTTGESGSISLGVQQPHFVIMISVDDVKEEITATLFPNPTGSDINVEINDQSELLSKDLAYQLHDLSGRLILRGNINSTLTKVSLEHLTDAVYILHLFDSAKEIKSFKIFKSR